MLTFDEYLTAKNIDQQRFRAAEPERYAEWEQLFQTLHPDSFTTQKKFLINDIRRRYILKNPHATD